MKIKGNWIAGIAIVYGGFAAFMVGFLIFASFQKVELVAPNYYEQEIKYQDHIDKIERTMNLPSRLAWNLAGRRMVLQFPAALKGRPLSGTVVLYRPSDSSFDRHIPLAVDADLRQEISLDQLVEGYWKMKVEWIAGSESYYDEDEFTL